MTMNAEHHEYAGLQELIDGLSLGTRLHISVVFLEGIRSEKLVLHMENMIHRTIYCEYAKSQPDGLKNCITCRNKAIEKAVRQKKAYGGYCINGLYEYCVPVFYEEKAVAVVFIGNIDSEKVLYEEYKDVLEHRVGEEQCRKIGRILESYIQFLMSVCPGDRDFKLQRSITERVKSYIDIAFMHNITLERIAQEFRYNESYLGRQFKKKYGVSIRSYMKRKRVEYAAQLLVDTQDKILHVGYKAGFDNVTYFNKAFKEAYGMAPGEYREKNRQL